MTFLLGPRAPGSSPRRVPGQARWLPWAALVVVYVVWGSTYLAIRVGVETIPPLLLAAIRYLAAGAVLYPLAIRLGGAVARRDDRPGRRQWLAAAVIGTLLLSIGNGGVSYAEQTVPSGLAALLVATVPLWMVGADRLVNAQPIGRLAGVALVVGLAGVAILAGPTDSGAGISGQLVLLVAAASWGLGSVLSGRVALPARPLVGSAMQMLAGGTVLALAAAVRGEFAQLHLDQVSTASLMALLYLIGPGSLLALSAYVVALQRLPTSTVATYAYVNPVVAVALGALLLNESISGRTLLGAGVVLGAVILTVTARNRKVVR
ncbi:MAG TPA: EamA family transporter [Propionibacteriaceae bacterium]|nr:EamA family transporter [Propionibacteriaceae bacterium]